MGWLEERLALLHPYCLPSMQAQSDSEFVWFMLFDEDTPASYVAEVCVDRRIVPIMACGLGQAVSGVQAHLRGPARVSTTRLNSDDAVAAPFVFQVRKVIETQVIRRGETDYALFFPTGAEYDSVAGLFYAREYPHNQFATLVERVGDSSPETVLRSAHYDLHRDTRVVQIPTNEPMWCTVLHSGNVSNTVKGTRSLRDYSDRFPVGTGKQLSRPSFGSSSSEAGRVR